MEANSPCIQPLNDIPIGFCYLCVICTTVFGYKTYGVFTLLKQFTEGESQIARPKDVAI